MPNNKIKVFNYRFLTKKYGSGLLLWLVLAGLFINISPAQAFLDVPYNISAHQLNALDFMDSVPKHLLNIMLLAGEMSVFAIISGQFLDFASTQPVNLDNPLVNMGWGFTSGLVNISFILIFIVIALSYILKVDTFKMQKTLPRLIIIALLINFSLLFVKMFADIGWLVQNSFKEAFFINGSLTDSLIRPLTTSATKILGEIGGQLATYAALGLVPFGPAVRMVWWLSIALPMEIFFGSFSYAVLVIIFGWIIGLIFLVYGVLFLLRIAAFWFLAILAPLAFAAFILPQTEKLFKQWLNALVQWSFLGVIALFLAGLGIRLFTYLFPEVGAFSTTGASGAGFNFVANYTRFVFLIIYLSAALAVSIKLAPKGTQIALGLAEMAVKKGGAWAGGMAKRRGMGLAAEWEKGKKEAAGEMAAKMETGGKPTFGERLRLGSWVRRPEQALNIRLRAEVKEKDLREKILTEEKAKVLKTAPKEAEDRKNYLQAELLKEETRGITRSLDKIAAIMDIMTKEGKIGKVEERFITDAVKRGVDPDKILERRPDLASVVSKALNRTGDKEIKIAEIMQKMTPEDARKKVQKEAYQNEEVVLHILKDETTFRDIERNGRMDVKKEIINTLNIAYPHLITDPANEQLIRKRVNEISSNPRWPLEERESETSPITSRPGSPPQAPRAPTGWTERSSGLAVPPNNPRRPKREK